MKVKESQQLKFLTPYTIDVYARVGYRLQKPYRGIPRYSATYRGTYHGIPQQYQTLTVIVKMSAAMVIHLIDMPTSHGV